MSQLRTSKRLPSIGKAFTVMDLCLGVVDGVRGDGLSSQGLHEDLRASTEVKHKVKSELLLEA